MEIKQYNLDRMELEQFAEKYGLIMEVRERSPSDSFIRYYARFECAEVKQNGMLVSEFGDGATIEEAIESYGRAISGKFLVIRAYSKERKEINVPILTNRKAKSEQEVDNGE